MNGRVVRSQLKYQPLSVDMLTDKDGKYNIRKYFKG